MTVVELMISKSRGFQVQAVEEVRDNLSFARLRARLDSALVLVSSVKVYGSISILLLNNVQEPGHIDKSSVSILLTIVLTV